MPGQVGHGWEVQVLGRALVIGIMLAVGASAVAAQDYPGKPVKIVVPFPAGGGTDALARFLARGFEQRLGQPFIIENRGGSGTTLGATAVARAQPDGYTIMLGTASTFAVAPGLYKRLAYDPNKDFSPIMLVAKVPFVLVVNPSLGVSSVKELVALAKSKPGELSYASAGVGAVHHIFCELFMTMTGIDMKHVPYRGGGQALNDVVAGHVPVYFADAGPAASLIRSGKLKALGVTTATRTTNLPEVPTLHEAGVAGYEANTWQMMVGPAQMPAPVVGKLNAALADFMRTPQAQQHFISLGMQPLTSTPEEARNYIRSESERWTGIIKAIGVSID
jgi:tripartite-type tricarboxylate transporter receptor subunit TctC